MALDEAIHGYIMFLFNLLLLNNQFIWKIKK